MRFRDDTRGVTVQIGAVLLFATIIIALATYQATVVPAQNADVEYQHSQQLQNQMTELRNALLRTAATGSVRPAAVTLGTQYPSRVFLLNPPPPAGTLATETYENGTIRVSNVQPTDDETADFFAANGDAWTASTEYLAYQPGYHEYGGAPNVVYGATMLSNHYPGQDASVPLTDQLLVRDNTITLVALNGSLSTSRAGAASVSATPVSAPYNEVPVTNETAGNVTVTVPTKLDAAALANATSLDEQHTVEAVEPASGDRVRVVLEPGSYTLQTAKLGVGSDVAPEDAHYLTVAERDDDSVTVEARDRFNSPVSGVRVSVSDGDQHHFESSSKRTGADGQATFEVVSAAFGNATLTILGGDAPRERVSIGVDGASGGAGSGGRVSYTGDAVARDGPDSNDVPGGVAFSVENEHAQSVTITDVTVEPSDGAIDVLADRRSGGGKFASELFIDADLRDSHVDFSQRRFSHRATDGVGLPREVDVDVDGRVHPGNPVVGPGSDATVYLYEFFRDADGSTNVNMVGEAVNVTVTYRLADQRVGETAFTITPTRADGGDGGGDGAGPEVGAFQVTDTSETAGNPKHAQFDIDWTVSDDAGLRNLELAMTRVDDGQQVDSATPAISGVREGGTTALRGEHQNSNPGGQRYEITVTVTDSDGNTTSETRTATV